MTAEEAEIDLASAGADPGVAELLGRDEELAQLYDLIDGIEQRGGALVVRGEAGIGKSALLEAAAVRARERDGERLDVVQQVASSAIARRWPAVSRAAPACART